MTCSDGDVFDPEDTLVEVWVEPEDGFKAVFFYNVIARLLEADSKPGVKDLIQIGTTLAYVDEFPVLVPSPYLLSYAATHATLATVSWIGWFFVYIPWLKKYTPEYIWDAARTRGGRLRDRKVD